MGTFRGVAYSVSDYEDNLPIYVPGNLSNGNFSWVETHKCLENGSLIAPVQINNITLTEASQVSRRPQLRISLSCKGQQNARYEKFRMTNLEWGVDFFSLTNLVKTS